LVIGVTGGVGTGKSTVSRMLASLGAEVVDADRLAHETILPHGAAYSELLREFGPGILRDDGAIDRRELGRRAFADREGALRINEIIHPHVIAAIRRRIEELRRQATAAPRALVLDVPLLFESGMDALCDAVWVVTADRAVQRERVARRDGPAAACEVLAREQHQLSMQDKVARAHAVIDNSGSEADTLWQVERLWRGLVA
jgi:dephospho-CoA kinase